MQKLSSILLVDDDPTSTLLNKRLLQSLGVTDQFLVACNGAEALTLLAQICAPPNSTCPALILLDVNMPVMNGIEFLEAYHPTHPTQQPVIFVLTTTVHTRDLTHIEGLPIAGLISKPLTKEKVDTILQEHFQRRLLSD